MSNKQKLRDTLYELGYSQKTAEKIILMIQETPSSHVDGVTYKERTVPKHKCTYCKCEKFK